jgi:hypothetical protein
VLCGAFLALLAGCAPKHVAPAKPKTELEAPASAAASVSAPARSSTPLAAVTNCRAPEAPVLSDAAVRALVAAWRSAQNKRDFSAYSAFYAEHFTGMSARGASLARLDRRTWLKVHQAELALDPALAGATALVASGAGGARVTFDNAAARALGARLPELFVVSSATGPKIAWEAPARTRASALSETAGLWLADEHFAILSPAPDSAWAEGAPSYSGDNTALRSVTVSKLPKTLRAWLGRPVRVLGASGAVCETRLQRFALRATITPDLPTAEVWEGCADEAAQQPEQIAQDIWHLSGLEGRSLVAEFSAPCKGALLAIDPELPAPPIAAPEPASAELGAVALEAFRKLPEYAEIQARFKTENPISEGAWEDRQGRRSVWTLQLPAHAPLLFVSVEAGAGCANFSASLSALWEVQDDGGAARRLSLLLVPSAEDDRRLTPSAVVDLDGSGAALLSGPDGVFSARSLVHKTSAGYRQTLLSSVPFFAGPC